MKKDKREAGVHVETTSYAQQCYETRAAVNEPHASELDAISSQKMDAIRFIVLSLVP